VRYIEIGGAERNGCARKTLSGETAVSDDYIEEVVKAYEHFSFHYTWSDLLVVNTNDIDFVERHTDLQGCYAA
jgi:deoxyadenosine/deoxycytidine kinase